MLRFQSITITKHILIIFSILLSLSLIACSDSEDENNTITPDPGPGLPPQTPEPSPADSFTLSIMKSGEGSVISNPAGINCGESCSAQFDSGTQVALSAQAASGFSFTGWSGSNINCPGTTDCNVSLTIIRTVTATFTANVPPPPPPTSATETLAWDSPSAELGQECPQDIAGYKLYMGSAPGVYTTTQTLPINEINCSATDQSGACGAIQTCTYAVENLSAGAWHFAVTVYDSSGIESVFSNNLEYTVEQP